MSGKEKWKLISPQELASLLTLVDGKERLVIDSRSFLEFNTCHIRGAINVSFSKMIKRDLQNHQLPVKQLLALSHNKLDFDLDYDVIVYDQCTTHPNLLSEDCFLFVLMEKLVSEFKNVRFLIGGLIDFQAKFHLLCDTQRSLSFLSSSSALPSSSRQKYLLSLSQPCMSFSSGGPTRILPFLFLGSQQDALSQEIMKQNGISYILNVSMNGEEPSFLGEGHFLRIPVHDSHNDKLLPYFNTAFQFIDKVREANGCVLVHCLAGISRSPTLAIAYLMKYLGLTCDEAYKYVKDKRPTISPNFNFLGQLLEYEKCLSPKSGTEAFLASSLDVESSFSGKVEFNSFSIHNNWIEYDKRIGFDSKGQTKSSEIKVEDGVREDFHENKSEVLIKVKQELIEEQKQVNRTMTEELPINLKSLPSRPSTLLHSSSETLSKLHFSTSAISLSRVKPSPILEVPSPEEVVRQKNSCLNDSLQLHREFKSASSHVLTSSHLELENTPVRFQEPNHTTSTSLTDVAVNRPSEDTDNINEHKHNIQRVHATHNFHHQRGTVQHHSQRLRTHLQKFNRRYNHSKSHLEYSPNYNHQPNHHQFYGFPQSTQFPYRFPPSHQCFPHFHSTQPPPIYFHRPCPPPGYVFLPNYPNYFNGHQYYGNVDLCRYENFHHGSHRHQHSFFASSSSNSFYHYPPTGNFVFKEDPSFINKSFSGRNSFPPADPFHPSSHFMDGHNSVNPYLRSERFDCHTDPPNDFGFSNKRSNQPTGRKETGASHKSGRACPLLSKIGNKSFCDNVDEVVTKGEILSKSTARNSPTENDMTSITSEHCFNRLPVSLPSSAAVTVNLSEASNGPDRLIHSLKKAPLRLRPNSIALQNIQLQSNLVNDSNCMHISKSTKSEELNNRDAQNLSNSKFQKEACEEDSVVTDNNLMMDKRNRSKFSDGCSENIKINFCSIRQDHRDVFRSVVREVHSLTDENETLCSSLISLSNTIRPNATANSFREALSSSASSSSSSSSRKSRSLEDIINTPRALHAATCTKIKRLDKSTGDDRCRCQSDEAHLPIFSLTDSYSGKDVDPNKQFKLLGMFNASHGWRSDGGQPETGGMPSSGGSQNSLHGTAEVVEVS